MKIQAPNFLISRLPIKRVNTFPKNNNLSPLSRDTVEFRGNTNADCATVGINDKRIELSDRANIGISNKIHNDAKPAYEKLKTILGEIFPEVEITDVDSYYSNRLTTPRRNKKKKSPVVGIITRRKKSASIAEKMAQTKSKSVHEAKENINDILGARILVTGKGTQGGDYVLEKLEQAAKEGKIRIAAIKNHGQDGSKFNFASLGAMKHFVKTVRNNGSHLCEFKDQPRDSGYIALHIITENIKDGYRAEIQIMNPELGEFKNIEDICYKCLAKKGVPKKYEPIKEMFKDIVDNEEKRGEYLEYIKHAYAQKRMEKAGKKEYKGDKFLTIPDDLGIDQRLDFNNIARFKAELDLLS